MGPMEYLIDTPWETRNLGIPSYQINVTTFLSAPDLGAFYHELELLEKDLGHIFVFARIPLDYLYLVKELEHVGFYVIECTVVPFIRLVKHEQLDRFEKDNELFLPEKFRNPAPTVSTITNPESETAAAIKKVASESFVDDRFHVDSNCSAEVADRRFVYWVEDLIANNNVNFDLLYVKDELAGFMARKDNHLILAGFSRTYRTAGLGEFLWLTSCKILKNMSYKTADTLISINNIAVLNLYARLGFKFKDTQYSLHYWGRPATLKQPQKLC